MTKVSLIYPAIQILTDIDGDKMLKDIEKAGRTCYRSEGRITEDSAEKFVRKLIDRGHEAMLEHAPAISVRFTVDRGISHELVRHRMASFAQESTRYCRYNEVVYCIEPTRHREDGMSETIMTPEQRSVWMAGVEQAVAAYGALLDSGVTPEIARSILPHCVATEIVVTANLREWRHIMKLRTDKAAHPQMRQIMTALLRAFKADIPVVFEDICV